MIAGLCLLLNALLKKTSKNELKKTGIPVEGIVFKQDYQPEIFSGSNSQLVKDQIFIRFVTLKKAWITEPINQEFAVFYSDQYKDGEPVSVYYDKNNPSNFYVDTKQSDIQGRLLFAIIGVAFIVTGIMQYLSIKTSG